VTTLEVQTERKSQLVPLIDGDLGLGKLQAIFLCEFDGPRTRNIHVVIH
jgi:thiamine phosphate synthase YjbQ (UPF0047 family)